MNRRGFIKRCVLGGLFISLPLTVDVTITIVNFKILDSFKDSIVMSGPHIDDDGIPYMNCQIDDPFEHIRLIDSDGGLWQTENEGKTWQNGVLSFSGETGEIAITTQ